VHGDVEVTRDRAWATLTRYTTSESLLRHALAVEASVRYYARLEELVRAVLSHADHLGLPRETPLEKTLYACDELSGFVHACGLVRPQGLEGLTPKSVRKKLKQPSFAAGVHRDEVHAGAALLGLELDEHIANVVAALQPISAELGLPAGAPSAD
jgi:predicted hydrolase (HD superfamily)